MGRKETGNHGEQLARDYLKKHGFSIIESNYRCPQGEIDIVARQKDTMVFVEVRTKQSLECGTPALLSKITANRILDGLIRA